MKIVDILESQNIQEGPLDTVGTAIGKTVGGVAKAAGAVAGGVAGIGTAVKKGYQAGKATVGGTSAPQTAKPGLGAKIAKVGGAVNRGINKAKDVKQRFDRGAEQGKEFSFGKGAKTYNTANIPQHITKSIDRLPLPAKIDLRAKLK